MKAPEEADSIFSLTNEPPVRECAYCRSDFKQRKARDEFGDDCWVGDFCCGLCRRLYFEEQREKRQ